MTNHSTGDPYADCLVQLFRSYGTVRRTIEVELARHELTWAHLYILMTLDVHREPLSLKEIASFTSREPHSISGLISRMQDSGFLNKVEDRKDRRITRIELTPKGNELVKMIALPTIDSARNLLASRLSMESAEQLNRYLNSIRQAAEEKLGKNSVL